MVAGLLNLADVALSTLIDGTVLLGRAVVKCFAQGHRGDKTAVGSENSMAAESQMLDVINAL